MRKRKVPLLILTVSVPVFTVLTAYAWVPLIVENDPLVRMPGTTQDSIWTLGNPGAVDLDDLARFVTDWLWGK